MELLSSNGNRGLNLNLLSKESDIDDTDYLSKYFVVTEFNPKFSPGKNAVAFNGSEFLKEGSEIQIECIDSSGNSLYIEIAKSNNKIYKEASSYVVSIHVYGDTSNGPGKLILFGTTKVGHSVKWVSNINIDKNSPNVSSVRFYDTPSLSVKPIQSPQLSDLSERIKIAEFSGPFRGYAVLPQKDFVLSGKQNLDTDYRVEFTGHIQRGTSASINSQLEGFPVKLMVKSLQRSNSSYVYETSTTSSFLIKKVLNERTFQLNDPFYVVDERNNKVVSNVVEGTFYITYPYISYNTASDSSSYLYILNDQGETVPVRTSYAEIVYKNIKTFTGYIARHKVYRKSLFSPGDFEVIADEPLSPIELLTDTTTTNKYFNSLGKFYNQNHIQRYWMTSSSDIILSSDSQHLIDSLKIDSNDIENLNGQFIIAKVDSSFLNRNAEYLPYIESEFSNQSGSHYDSNFIELQPVPHLLSFNIILEKSVAKNDLSKEIPRIDFFFTSSEQKIIQEKNYYPGKGVLLGSVDFKEEQLQKRFKDKQYFSFNPKNNLHGTLIISPIRCRGYISDLSLKVYGDDGFSPDVLATRIPFPISVPNESFEIKSELFDINSNLIYNNLKTIQSFDPSGSTLNSYVPGQTSLDGTGFTIIKGSLLVSQSLYVRSDTHLSKSLYLHGLNQRTCTQPSPKFILGIDGDNQSVFLWPYNCIRGSVTQTTIGGGSGLKYDDKWLWVPGASSNKTINFQSLTGRKIYWVGNTKVISTEDLTISDTSLL